MPNVEHLGLWLLRVTCKNLILVANLSDKTSKYEAKCDIFSAGVIFHILLLGESLFTGRGHLELLR